MKRLLLIDDEEKLRNLLARVIGVQGEGFQVDQAGTLKAARQKLTRAQFDVVLCDVRLPDGSGVEFVHEVRQIQPLTEIILLTAYGNIPDGVQAIKNGAFDYITKGDDNNRIIPLINRAYEKVLLAKRVQQLERRVGQRYSFDNIIGNSRQIQEAVGLGKKVAQTDTTVLLLGETGTGKEVFAQAIHHAGTRSRQPFVAVNCSAFSRELLESELFGHREGAFTGASKDKKGLFSEADGGTIFLDEIGEMSYDLQAKLLRVLEIGEFLMVGDTVPTRVDVRIVAATNRNLETEIDQGHFRSDLYYRLSIFTITLPPLRERPQDIKILAAHFAQTFALKMNKQKSVLSDNYVELLESHPWKGNIRELKNVIERSVILSEGNTLNADTLPYEFFQSNASPLKPSLSAFSLVGAEKLQIQKVLNHTGGNKAEAARLLEIGVATLYRKIAEYQIG
ncbi:sigma-54-dependent transcriptional regulator [Parapedobacter koreensis]|uniref:DNA-binding transcriptional response regulator, NtrC family, contains REC, AAA-type ATPase, and a Fis-type DNA-binding domains n=1 Tax=Parapedobacter koreensis TaxID=332977 RepID=A0A1H7MGJ6_9SPHI|nr:sigma-54 dependent transcriptional regulator [Parapedobacter koreensis]SEL10028.1 DNA-binding transcriptional response regulator, NtrC family, contains REC, AAA-type ATPase, and a Fis-type DNA-binding domains [Parapedobacter koreensis]